MKKNKKGFTLVEVLLVVTIAGIIMATLVSTVLYKIKNSYTNLTYFAFKGLQGAVTAMMAGAGPETHFERTDIKLPGSSHKVASPLMSCKENNTIKSILRGITKTYNTIPNCSTVYAETGTTQSTAFCENLAALSKTTGDTSCSTSSLFDVTKGTTPSFGELDFATATPNIVTVNGMRYFISKWTYDAEKVSSRYGFRLVGIDLNGKKSPNSATSAVPDVVTFMVLDSGEIFPLGAAADNVPNYRYLPATVKGYYFSQDAPSGSASSIPNDCRGDKCTFRVVSQGGIMSYREAYCYVYGESTPEYKVYCVGKIPANSVYCAHTGNLSGRFDLCKIETIKPAFRFNFN